MVGKNSEVVIPLLPSTYIKSIQNFFIDIALIIGLIYQYYNIQYNKRSSRRRNWPFKILLLISYIVCTGTVNHKIILRILILYKIIIKI